MASILIAVSTPIASDNHRVNTVVFFNVIQRRIEFEQHGFVDSIKFAGSVKADNSDWALLV